MLLTPEEIEAIFDTDINSSRRQDLINRLVDEHTAAIELGSIVLAGLSECYAEAQITNVLDEVEANETKLAKGKAAFESRLGMRF